MEAGVEADPCVVEDWEANLEAGVEAGVIGDKEEGRSMVSRAYPWHLQLVGGKKKARERRRKKRVEVQRCNSPAPVFFVGVASCSSVHHTQRDPSQRPVLILGASLVVSSSV